MAVNRRMSNKYPETSKGEPSREPGRGDATPSHEVGAAPTRRRLSVVEIRQASDEISKLLGYSDGIKRAKREMFAKYGLSPKRTTRLIKAILASWHAEAEASRKDQKDQANPPHRGSHQGRWCSRELARGRRARNAACEDPGN